jgi:hypothetical protein
MTFNEGSDHYVTLPFRKSESLSPHSSFEQTRLNGGPKWWEWHYFVSYIIFTLRWMVVAIAVLTLSILLFHAQRLGKYPIDSDWDSILLSSNPVFSYPEVRR